MSTKNIHVSYQHIHELIRISRLSTRIGRWRLLSLEQIKSTVFTFKDIETPSKINTNGVNRRMRVLTPLFERFPNCMVIAGGFFNVVHNSDIDVFFYNIDKKKLEEIINYVVTGPLVVSEWSRNRNIISATIMDETISVVVQFITRIYKTKDSILGSFDVGGSEVLYDGKNYLFTIMGAVCNIMKIIITDTTKYSPMYERRLVKYRSDKRFDIIFPELKVTERVCYRIGKLLYNSKYGRIEISNSKDMLGMKRGYGGFGYDGSGCTDFHYYMSINYISTTAKDPLYLSLMHIRSSTYEGLFNDPHYFTQNEVFDMISTIDKKNMEEYKSLMGLELWEMLLECKRDIGKMYRNIAAWIVDDDNGTYVTACNMKIDSNNVIINKIINDTVDAIMVLHDKAIESVSNELNIVSSNTFESTPITAQEWYGENYEDVGIDVLPLPIDAIEQSNLSEYVKRELITHCVEIMERSLISELFLDIVC